jgi:diaminohydroxyphosphoribosylaminopyrimidine deaminase/5-amino-6-(5-phosphoribosylamino)uracil reductase
VVTARAVDERYMRRALFHAARGAGRTTPNPLVGAVVLSADGVLVGQGYHERAGEPHAEVHALEAAGDAARGGTLYVTLEPCCHVGRTGPCTRRIIAAGIARVVAAMRDPDPRVSGKGFDELRAHGIAVDVGVCEADAQRLNAAFITTKTAGRPLVIVKAATSLDARVAARPGERTAISSREANQQAHRVRASIDAIAVGSETILTDNPLLTSRGCYRERPLTRVIFDRRLRTPPTARIFGTLDHGPVVIVASAEKTSSAENAEDAEKTSSAEGTASPEQALREAGAKIIRVGSLHSALNALVAEGVMTLLVEGGPTLHRAFAEAGLIDRVHLVIAPQVLGDRGVKWLDVQTLELARSGVMVVEPRGPDIWIEADVHRDR